MIFLKLVWKKIIDHGDELVVVDRNNTIRNGGGPVKFTCITTKTKLHNGKDINSFIATMWVVPLACVAL